MAISGLLVRAAEHVRKMKTAARATRRSRVADALPRLAARTDDEVRVWDTLSELRPREGQLEQCKHYSGRWSSQL